MQPMDLKAANEHLVAVGKELEQHKADTARQFFCHTIEDGRAFWKDSAGEDWTKLYEAEAPTLTVNTLTAIKDYLTLNPDNLDLSTIMVHVVDPVRVNVVSAPFGGWKQRATHMQAQALIPRHRFDQFESPDIFVPYLQSCFCPGEHLADLLKITGNLVDTSEVSLKDDGVSQEVSIRHGAARKAEVPVPSPAILYPFSTFSEVEQPARKFVFRLSSLPLKCALLEADGGAWKLAAIQSIAAWLAQALPNAKVIA